MPRLPRDGAPYGKTVIWPIRLTRIGMIAERAARAFWMLWVVLLLVFATLLLGLVQVMPLEVLWLFMVVSAFGTGWAALAGFRRFEWPSAVDAAARLDSTLTGRPIAALADTQAIGASDAASQAVWQAHLRRMMSGLAKARPVRPDLTLARFDRYGLRYVALTLFVTGLLFGTALRLGEVGQPIATGAPAIATGPSWEGWIEPPAYTGKPGLYLNDLGSGSVTVPVGSRVELRLYGAVGALALSETVSGRTGDPEPAAAMAHGFEVAQAGEIRILGAEDADWRIALTGDKPPEITPEGPVRRSASGEMTQEFRARDDYGVVSGEALITLDLGRVDRRYGLAPEPEPRADIVAPLPLPVTGDRAELAGEFVEDFSRHPWANLPVTLTLRAEDARGGTGASEPVALDALPGRRFFDPLAQALIEQRRDLLWTADNAPRVAQMLRAISHRPEDLFRSETDYLRTRFIARDLEALGPEGLQAKKRDEIAEALWELAMRIEEGDLSDAMARLRRAQERLSEAMRDGASDEEIADLMQELREAMQDYMRQLAEQMRENGEQRNLADAQELSGQQLQDMLDRLQQLMEEGRMAEAQALLDQLSQMMQNMQMAQNQGQGQPSPGEQAMRGLQETLRNQQNLSDDSFQGLQGQQGDGQQGQSQQGQGQQGGSQPGTGQSQGGMQPGEDGGGSGDLGQQLADRQEQLRQELQRQRDGLPGAGQGSADARQSLDEAGRAMDDAEQSLRQNDLAGAMDSQAEAMDRLRDGIQSLGEEMAQQQQQGGGQQGQAMGQAGPNAQRDPLGREPGGDGQLGTRDNLLQDEDVYRRARDLLDEIRRRSGDQTRPEVELDYLRRLLDRF